MKNLHTNFVSTGKKARLVVYVRNGKKGINIGVSRKVEGEKKATPGCQSTFAPDTPEDEVIAAYDQLVADAKAQGWTMKVRPVAKPRERKQPTFTTIPSGVDTDEPTEAPADEPAVVDQEPNVEEPKKAKVARQRKSA